jgi:hypothetical protein
LGSLTVSAPAGPFSDKKAKQDPSERVSQLILAVKTDKDEDIRANAAHELREFDPAKHPEIVPILVEVLQNDQKPVVRTEAAATLAKFRPVSQEVGMALEQATKDSSFRVRWQARSSLMSYRLAGYRSGPRMDETNPVPQDDRSANKSRGLWSPFGRHPSSQPSEITTMPQPEPAAGKSWIQRFSFGKRPSNQPLPPVTTTPFPSETPPPPLAQPEIRYVNPSGISARPQLTPSDTPRLQRAPSQSGDAGPELPADK